MKNAIKFSFLLILGLSLFSSCEQEEVIPGGEITVDSEITENQTWNPESVYVIDGDVYVDGNAIITILPGTIVRFNPGASLRIGYSNNATLKAIGSLEKPIKFTSTATSPVAGSWEGLHFYENSLNSVLKNCIVEYAGDNNAAAINIHACDMSIDSCSISKTANDGIYAGLENNKGGFTSFTYNNFTDIAGFDIDMHSAKVHTIGANNTFFKALAIDGDYESTTPRTWKKLNKPYIVNSYIYIDGDLTIEPGSVFKFGAEGYFLIGYSSLTKFVANGTSSDPILFTSSAASPTAGAWRGLEIYSHTQSNSSLNNCIIEYAGKEYDMAISLEDAEISFTGSTIRHSTGYGIHFGGDSGFTEFRNNTISVTGHVLSMSALKLPSLGVPNSFTPGAGKGIEITSGGNFTTPVVWKKQTADLYIDTYIYIDGEVTVEPGTTFKMGDEGYFLFGYDASTTFKAIGTSELPITFTSAAANPTPGSWRGLEFYELCTSNTTFNYCKFNYGGRDDYSTLTAYSNSALTINNSQINNHGGSASMASQYSNATISGGVGNNFTWSLD